jgi:hypothetical protein
MVKGFYVRSNPFQDPAWYLGAHGLGLIHAEPERLDRCVVFFKHAAIYETEEAARTAAIGMGCEPGTFQILPGIARNTNPEHSTIQ